MPAAANTVTAAPDLAPVHVSDIDMAAGTPERRQGGWR